MSNLDTFFTDAFESISDKEAFYKAVFMNTDSEEAAPVLTAISLRHRWMVRPLSPWLTNLITQMTIPMITMR